MGDFPRWLLFADRPSGDPGVVTVVALEDIEGVPLFTTEAAADAYRVASPDADRLFVGEAETAEMLAEFLGAMAGMPDVAAVLVDMPKPFSRPADVVPIREMIARLRGGPT